MSIQNISPANLAIIEKQKKSKNTNIAVQKTETKDNKKKILLALGGLAAIGVATVAIYTLTKNNKKAAQAGQDLSKKGEDILQNLTKPNNSSEIIDEAAQKAQKLEEEAQNMKKLLDNLDSPKFLVSDIGSGYVTTPAVINKNSVEEDLAAWIQKRNEAPLLSSIGKNLNSPDDIGLDKIKPHNYTQTSDILIKTREFDHGYLSSGFMVDDDKLKILDGADISKYKKFKEGATGLIKGIDENGKAYVYFGFRPDRHDCKGRPCLTVMILRSKTSEFNQDQLDLIKAWDNAKLDEKSPLGLSFVVSKETSRNAKSELYFNKNMFLSLIHHFAN